MILGPQPVLLSSTAKINSQRLSHGKVIHHSNYLNCICFVFFSRLLYHCVVMKTLIELKSLLL